MSNVTESMHVACLNYTVDWLALIMVLECRAQSRFIYTK